MVWAKYGMGNFSQIRLPGGINLARSPELLFRQGCFDYIRLSQKSGEDVRSVGIFQRQQGRYIEVTL